MIARLLGKLIYGGSSAYCCLGVLPDGRVGLLYERDGYGKITFAAFELDWLTGGGDAKGATASGERT